MTAGVFSAKCPRCGTVFGLAGRTWRERRHGKYGCPNCRAVIELENGAWFGLFAGAITAVLFVCSAYWGMPNPYVRFALVVLLGWLFLAAMVRYVSRWQVVGEAEAPGVLPPDPPVAGGWRQRANSSVVVGLAATSLGLVIMALQFHHITSLDPDDVAAIQRAGIQFPFVMGISGTLLALGLVCLLYSIYATARRSRAVRDHYRQGG